MSRASKFRHLPVALAAGALTCAGQAAATAPAVQSLQSIRAAAEQYVMRRVPAGEHPVHVTAGDLDPRLRLAPCPGPLHVTEASNAPLQARMTVGVGCRQGVTWTVYVPVTIESELPVLVLRAAAARGSRLDAGDVVVQKRRVPGIPSGYVTDVRSLEGHTLRRSLAPGTALTKDALVPDVIVRRGDQVTLLAATGGIEVRASGLALSDGRDGARIRVQNLSSKQVVEGVVEGGHVIRVTP